MQLQPVITAGGEVKMAGVKPYTGIMDAVTMIVKEEGALGLYKGTPQCTRLLPAHILQYASQERPA